MLPKMFWTEKQLNHNIELIKRICLKHFKDCWICQGYSKTTLKIKERHLSVFDSRFVEKFRIRICIQRGTVQIRLLNRSDYHNQHMIHIFRGRQNRYLKKELHCLFSTVQFELENNKKLVFPIRYTSYSR